MEETFFKKNFIIEFDKLLKNSKVLTDNEYEKYYNFFILNKNDNEKYLLEKLKEFSIEKWYEFIVKFHIVTKFIKYLWNKGFISLEISEELKNILDFISTKDDFEKYSNVLLVLFSIKKQNNDGYYTNLYKDLKNENKLYHDINFVFFEIFIQLRINRYFISSFQQIIIDNSSYIYYTSVEKWLNYLIGLGLKDFKKYFIELLKFFDLEENKKKLIYDSEYNWLINTHYTGNKKFLWVIDKLLTKLREASFEETDLKFIKKFIISDIDFSLKKYNFNILNNIFLNWLFKYFFNEDNNFLLEVLERVKSNNIHLLGNFISKYLIKSHIESLIDLYKPTENISILFSVYSILKQTKWKKLLARAFEKSNIWNEIEERNKNIEKYNIKNKKEEKLEKVRENIFSCINDILFNFRNFVYNYLQVLNEYKSVDKIFNKEEVKNINKFIEQKIYLYLDDLKIKNYNDVKIREIIIFKKSINWVRISNDYFNILNIIDISRYIKLNLKKYYKIFILFFPLILSSQKCNEFIELFWDNFKRNDINYVLKSYSEDLHENAKWLRYYNISNLINFYWKFKLKFNKTQKYKLEKICLGFINLENESILGYKKEILSIYSYIWWYKKLLKLKKKYHNEYWNLNYFKDYLDNNLLDQRKKDWFQFLTFIVQELVIKYNDIDSVLWSIKQVKNGLIEAYDKNEIKYPNNFTVSKVLTYKDFELSHWWVPGTFSYLFNIIPRINVFNYMLDLLDYSFKIQEDLLDWKLIWDYKLYCFYIRWIFYEYIKNLDEKLIKKDYYYSLLNILSKYDYKVTYNFNLSEIKTKFWIDDFEEEAQEIMKKWKKEIKKLLYEKQKLQYDLSTFKIANDSLEKEIKVLPKDKDYILFVEWKSDKIILENAWLKLKGDVDIPYRIENWYSCTHINVLFWDDNNSVMDTDINKIFIWMLDFDSAYKHFDLISKNQNWEYKQNNVFNWFLIKHKTKKWYLFLLPVPYFRKGYINYDSFDKSTLSIEFLFKDDILLEEAKKWDYIYKKKSENNTYKFPNNKKIKFAEKTRDLHKNCFENFNKIFDLTEKIINWEFE